MPRSGPYLPGPTRATTPSVWIAVCLDYHEYAVGTLKNVTHRAWQSAVVGVSYRKRSGWTHPEFIRVGTGDSLRGVLCELSLPNRVNWVITPSVVETFTLSGEWHVWETTGIVWRGSEGLASQTRTRRGADSNCRVDSLALSDSTGAGRFRAGDREWQWVDARNYGFSRAGNRTGSARAPEDVFRDGCDGVNQAERQSTALAREYLHFVTRWCDWWKANAKRPWSTTSGRLAMGMLETLTTPKTVCQHTCPAAHRLERAAAFGGRASIWYVGNVGNGLKASTHISNKPEESASSTQGQLISLVDVRSMYTYLLQSRKFPVRLVGLQSNPSLARMWETSEQFATIARVSITTDVPEYPHREDKRVGYPVGTFTTTLTGPELLALREHGRVNKCHELAIYHQSNAFAAVSSSLLASREIARAAGDTSGESFVKRVSVSLAGKLAQRRGRWVRDELRDQPGKWGEEFEYYVKTKSVHRWRWICGMASRWEDDPDGAGPYTFVFAYLASYGRLLMRSIREQLPARSVLSQDTDGIWVTSAGIAALKSRGLLDGQGPGTLRIVASARNARFFSPRHYCVDGRWVLSGYAGPVHEYGAESLWSETVRYPWSEGCRTAPSEVRIVHRKWRLHVEAGHGIIGEDGWISPRRLHLEATE